MRIKTYFPNYCIDSWVAHSCLSIVDGLLAEGVDIDMMAFCRAKNIRARHVCAALPLIATRVIRSSGSPLGRWIMDARFSRRLLPGDVAYFWLDSDAKLIGKLRRRGVMVAREMVNCTLKRRRQELRRAYGLLGMSFDEPTDIDVEREADQLNACDAVFCPNPQVRESVIEVGVSPSKCIDCSYGWSESRFPLRTLQGEPRGEFQVLFAGSGDVRKGLPWLLRAWKKSQVRGTLLLAGTISADVSRICAEELSMPSVKCLGHQAEMGEIYNRADVFAFPSWEEGGPMVTLEAMAHGLPCLVTPMGTSGAVTQKEGIIVEPGSVDQMAEALVALSADSDLRRTMGESARRKADCYTWSAVARRRLAGLSAVFESTQWRV